MMLDQLIQEHVAAANSAKGIKKYATNPEDVDALISRNSEIATYLTELKVYMKAFENACRVLSDAGCIRNCPMDHTVPTFLCTKDTDADDCWVCNMFPRCGKCEWSRRGTCCPDCKKESIWEEFFLQKAMEEE